jgi:predicted small lipoprotein YifL
MMNRVKWALMLVLFGASWFIASCGQSGPLYLPDEEEMDEKEQVSMPHYRHA